MSLNGNSEATVIHVSVDLQLLKNIRLMLGRTTFTLSTCLLMGNGYTWINNI